MPRPIHIYNEQSWRVVLKLINALNLEHEWDITIERHKKKRSLGQNALMHKYFEIIADETGNSAPDIKEAYRDMFLGKVPVVLGTEERLAGRSTTALTTKEMSEFLEKILAHAGSELGIVLPLPDDRGRDER